MDTTGEGISQDPLGASDTEEGEELKGMAGSRLGGNTGRRAAGGGATPSGDDTAPAVDAGPSPTRGAPGGGGATPSGDDTVPAVDASSSPTRGAPGGGGATPSGDDPVPAADASSSPA